MGERKKKIKMEKKRERREKERRKEREKEEAVGNLLCCCVRLLTGELEIYFRVFQFFFKV